MRIIITLLIFVLFSCNDNTNSFELNGKTDLDDGLVIYRIVPNSLNQPVKMDSTLVRSGKFNFSLKVNEIDVNFLSIKGKDVNIPFIIEKGKIKRTR